MKIKEIKPMLEKLNTAITYLVFSFTLICISAFALFFVSFYFTYQEIYPNAIIDILILIVLLGLTISSKGAVSGRRTVLMVLFGLLNTYGVVTYAFYYAPNLLGVNDFTLPTQILLYISVALSFINILLLILRLISLGQYEICDRSGIIQLNKETYFSTFKTTFVTLGIGILTLFVYGLIYQGFSLLVDSLFMIFDYSLLELPSLILSIVLLVVPVGFIIFTRRKLINIYKKYLGFAAFFGILFILSIAGLGAILALDPASYLLIDVIYLIVVNFIGFVISLSLIILNNKESQDNQ